MPSFTVEHETKLTPHEAYNKVRDYLQHSEGLKKLDDSLQYKFDDAAQTGSIKGSKFEVVLKILSGASTKVALNVDLHFLLSPFKGKIQDTLKEKMTKILG